MKSFLDGQHAIMDKINDSSSLFSQGYYILYFISSNDGEIYVYDTREPLRALKDIINKQPLHEFLRIESYPNEATTRDICRVFRLSREARIKLLPSAETVKVIIEKIASAAATAASSDNS